MKHELAIITVNYENYKVTEELFQSLKKNASHNFILYVVDISQEKKRFSEHDFLRAIHSENKGYANGVNLGLRQAIDEGFERFAIINNDIEVDKEFSRNVVKSIDRSRGGLIGGKIYYFPGYEFHKQRYNKKDLGKVFWYAGGSVDFRYATVKHRGVDEIDKGQYDRTEETSFITGCLVCFDKETLLKIGFWDESFFLYFEDADWSERAKMKGLKLYYDPSIVIWHKNSQSTGGSGSELHQTFQQKNQLKFGLRYAPLKTKLHLLKNYLLERFLNKN